MEMIPVTSSNIRKIGYDQESRTMRVLFQSGSEYDHFDVPKEAIDAFMDSKSKGRHYAEHFKNKFGCTKV